MPKKKNEEVEETTAAEPTETETAEETAVEATSKKAGAKKAKETPEAEGASIVDDVIETVSSAVETVAEAVVGGASAVVEAVTGSSADTPEKKKKGKRAEKIGVVASDKMTKTVVVRVDRLVKHPIYRKYVKKRKKFMAHDETGAKIGDKVRIVETRPLSARKRWRVVEIIQKAEM